jgi:ketosteroid isomerase-like protein
VENDELQIVKLFEDGDCALVSGDEAELRRIYADDYVQYDERGRASTRADLIERLLSAKTRFVSMVSTQRSVRMLGPAVAVVHGSEQDEVEMDGKRSAVRYVYTDVVIKRGGEWRIVVSQLARV